MNVDINRIVCMYNKGYTLQEIANEHGCSKQYVHSLIKASKYKVDKLDMGNRIKLTDDIKKFIKLTRESCGYKLFDVEEKSNKKYKVSWLSQLEGTRTRTVKKNVLIDLFSIILDMSEEDAEKYINSGFEKLGNISSAIIENSSNIDINCKVIHEYFRNQYPDANEITVKINNSGISITYE